MRFEIVGVMRGTVATDESLALHNVSRGGALVEAPWPLHENSIHTVRLEFDSTLATVDARVCHVRRPASDGTYLIGLEFLATDALAQQGLEVLLAAEADV